MKMNNSVIFPAPETPKFTFIDLFAGVGGFRLALQNLGGKCVFTSEWDKFSQKTYAANFGDEDLYGDITQEETKKSIPDGFDILCAGFPCQAFSLAGKRLGFEDTRGTLFFDVAEIISRKKPKAVLLENVRGLLSHDNGYTIARILGILRDDLGYDVPAPKVLNAADFGVPQNRERVFIVGFRNDLSVTDFSYPGPLDKKVVFGDIKEEIVNDIKMWVPQKSFSAMITHKERHKQKGNGLSYKIINDNEILPTLTCFGHNRGHYLVIDNRMPDTSQSTKEINTEGIRRLTPRECARAQGFPDDFVIPVSDSQAYKQFGNSVAVPAVQATAYQMLESLGVEQKHYHFPSNPRQLKIQL